MNWLGSAPPLHGVEKADPRAALQGLDLEEHLAELARAAGLLLVPVVAFGPGGDGFAVRDTRWFGRDLDVVLVRHAVEDVAHMEIAEAADDGLVDRGVVLDVEGGVLGGKLVERVRDLLLVG